MSTYPNDPDDPDDFVTGLRVITCSAVAIAILICALAATSHCAEPTGHWLVTIGDIHLRLHVRPDCPQTGPCSSLIATDQHNRTYRGWSHAGRITLAQTMYDQGWSCVLFWNFSNPSLFAMAAFIRPDPWIWTLDSRLVACSVKRRP